MRKVTLLASLTLLFAFAGAAEAKSPPIGKYHCSIDSYYQLFGSISIKSLHEVRRFGQTGTYTASKRKRSFSGGSVKGYSLRFKGGPLNRYTGYWSTSVSGTHELVLKDPGMGFVSIYCAD